MNHAGSRSSSGLGGDGRSGGRGGSRHQGKQAATASMMMETGRPELTGAAAVEMGESIESAAMAVTRKLIIISTRALGTLSSSCAEGRRDDHFLSTMSPPKFFLESWSPGEAWR